MDWEDRITVDAAILAGKPIVKGTRLSVEFIVDLLGRGWTVEDVLREYDNLTREDIRACLAYVGYVLKGEKVYLVRWRKAATTSKPSSAKCLALRIRRFSPARVPKNEPFSRRTRTSGSWRSEMGCQRTSVLSCLG